MRKFSLQFSFFSDADGSAMQTRIRATVAAWAVVSLLSLTTDAGAQNRLSIDAMSITEASPSGSTAVRIDCAVPIYAYQVSIVSKDPASLRITGFSTDGSVADGADFSGGTVSDDGSHVSWGVVVDLSAPELDRFIDPGDGQLAGELALEAVDFAPDEVRVELEDRSTFPPAKNKLVSVEGDEILGINLLTSGATIGLGPPAKGRTFIRGDSNDDLGIDLSDGVFTLNHLFLGGDFPPCIDAADANDSGGMDLADAIYLFNHLFLGGAPPPAPFPDAGNDPTDDGLSCGD